MPVYGGGSVGRHHLSERCYLRGGVEYDSGFRRLVSKSDNEPAVIALKKVKEKNSVLVDSSPSSTRPIKQQIRALLSGLQDKRGFDAVSKRAWLTPRWENPAQA